MARGFGHVGLNPHDLAFQDRDSLLQLGEGQWAKIDALNFRSRFDCIIVTADLTAEAEGNATTWSKPHPRAFEEAAQQLDVPNPSCVYVADNVTKDFVAPNALGWTTVRIVREGGVYCDAVCPAGGEAHHSIKTLDDLDALLR